jgi:hypothetical protein
MIRGMRREARCAPSPRSCGERVGVRGCLSKICVKETRGEFPSPAAQARGDLSPQERGEVENYASTPKVSPALASSRLISLCCIAAPGVQMPPGTSLASRSRQIAHSEIIFEVEP